MSLIVFTLAHPPPVELKSLHEEGHLLSLPTHLTTWTQDPIRTAGL